MCMSHALLLCLSACLLVVFPVYNNGIAGNLQEKDTLSQRDIIFHFLCMITVNINIKYISSAEGKHLASEGVSVA